MIVLVLMDKKITAIVKVIKVASKLIISMMGHMLIRLYIKKWYCISFFLFQLYKILS